jgi:hypothetical protein
MNRNGPTPDSQEANITFDRTAGSHPLAAAGQRARSPYCGRSAVRLYFRHEQA